MAISHQCECGHYKTGHHPHTITKKKEYVTTVYEQCLWDECTCKKFRLKAVINPPYNERENKLNVT